MRAWSLALLLAVSVAHAGDSGEGSLLVEGGSSFANMAKITASEDASKSTLGTHQLIFSVSGFVWGFKPELAYTILARSGPDDSYRSRLLAIQIPYVVAETGAVRWKAGPSFWIHSVSGDGGTIELNNGTGTSTFYKPSGSKSARTFAFTAGGTLAFGESPFGLDFDFHLLSPLSNRRTLNAVVQVYWSVL